MNGLRAFAFGSLLTLVLFADVVFGDRTFVGRDVQLVYMPLREFWVAHGPFAGWYPYDGLGQSFIGLLVGGVLHPMQWLNPLLGPVAALKWTTLLCFPLAFAGTALLARRVTAQPWAPEIAGAAYAFSGYLVSMTDNPLYLVSAATLPWVAVTADDFVEKPTVLRSLIAGGVTASVLLAGDAMGFGTALGAVVFTGLLRGHLRRGAIVAVISVLMSGPQLVPLLMTGPLTSQAHQPLELALKWSLHPLRLLEMAVGPIFAFDPGEPALIAAAGHMHEGAESLWAKSIFMGAPVLALAALGIRAAPKKRLALAAATLLLVLALGRNALVAEPLFALLAGLRYPEKFLPGLVLLIALAAALGVSQVKEASRGWVLAAFAVAALLLFFITPPELKGRVMSWSTVTFVALVATLRWPVAALLPVFAAVHLTTTVEDPAALHSPSPFAAVVGPIAKAGHWRVATHVQSFALPDQPSVAGAFAAAAAVGFQPDTAALDGLETSNTYLPGVMQTVTALRELSPYDYDRLTSTRYAAVFKDDVKDRPVLATDAVTGISLVEISDALPRVSFTDGAVTVTTWEPSHLVLHVEANTAGRLILRDAYAPGWSATLDAAPAPIEVELGTFRALDIAAGPHDVTFDYATPGLTAGLVLLALGVLLAGASSRLT